MAVFAADDSEIAGVESTRFDVLVDVHRTEADDAPETVGSQFASVEGIRAIESAGPVEVKGGVAPVRSRLAVA